MKKLYVTIIALMCVISSIDLLQATNHTLTFSNTGKTNLTVMVKYHKDKHDSDEYVTVAVPAGATKIPLVYADSFKFGVIGSAEDITCSSLTKCTASTDCLTFSLGQSCNTSYNGGCNIENVSDFYINEINGKFNMESTLDTPATKATTKPIRTKSTTKRAANTSATT